MIYLNLSTLALKRLREEAQRIIQERRDQSDARIVAALHHKKPKSPATVQSPTRKREIGTEGKVKKKRVDAAVPSKKVKSSTTSATREASAGMPKITESEKHHRDLEHRLSPGIGSPPPSSPELIEKCKKMELKLTKCDILSSNSSNSDDEITIKTSQFYSHTNKKQTPSSSGGQLSTTVAPSEENKEERRVNHKIRKMDSSKNKISSIKNLRTSVKVRDMEFEPTHAERKKTSSDVEPDVCVLEGADLELELFGGSPDSDHGDCIVISSEDDEEQGTSFENALTRVDDFMRKPKSKLHGHKKKLPSDKRHKKLKLSSVAGKSKPVRRRSSDQESMPHSSHSEVVKGNSVSVSPSEEQRIASGAGPLTKKHLEELKMAKKPYSSQKVVSSSKMRSPPLSTPAESPESSSLYQPPPGPLINLTKVAAQHSRKKTPHVSSSRKRSSGGDESKLHLPPPPPKRAVVASSETTPKASFTIFKKKEVVLTGTCHHGALKFRSLQFEMILVDFSALVLYIQCLNLLFSPLQLHSSTLRCQLTF